MWVNAHCVYPHNTCTISSIQRELFAVGDFDSYSHYVCLCLSAQIPLHLQHMCRIETN